MLHAAPRRRRLKKFTEVTGSIVLDRQWSHHCCTPHLASFTLAQWIALSNSNSKTSFSSSF